MYFQRSKNTLDQPKKFLVTNFGGSRPRWVPLDLPQAILF